MYWLPRPDAFVDTEKVLVEETRAEATFFHVAPTFSCRVAVRPANAGVVEDAETVTDEDVATRPAADAGVPPGKATRAVSTATRTST